MASGAARTLHTHHRGVTSLLVCLNACVARHGAEIADVATRLRGDRHGWRDDLRKVAFPVPCYAFAMRDPALTSVHVLRLHLCAGRTDMDAGASRPSSRATVSSETSSSSPSHGSSSLQVKPAIALCRSNVKLCADLAYGAARLRSAADAPSEASCELQVAIPSLTAALATHSRRAGRGRCAVRLLCER
eukprot:257967-Rhodomonas_salina.1